MSLKVSIITVVHNRSGTIDRCIQSVRGQSYHPIEYIVVDGQSDDGTVEIIKKHTDFVSRLVSEPDKGMYDALNKGIRMCTGDIVGVLHADDIFSGDKVVEKIVRHFKQFPQTDAIYGDVAFVKGEDLSKVVRYYSSKNFKPSLLPWGFIPAHPTFFCYRKFYEQYGLYRTDLEIAADFDLLLRYIHKHQLRIDYMPMLFTCMNMGGKSTAGLRSTIRINKELKQVLKEHALPSQYWRLYSRYIIKVWEYLRVGGKREVSG